MVGAGGDAGADGPADASGAGGDSGDASAVCGVQVAAGGLHTCARKGNGTLWCWGYGALGNGSFASSQLTPVEITVLGGNVAHVSAGSMTTCAVRQGGTLWCWGGNSSGQVGDGTTAGDEVVGNQPFRIWPKQVALSNVVKSAAGGRHTCAVDGTGALYCWGHNIAGQLGDTPARTPPCFCSPTPTRVVALGNIVADVAVGEGHTCAVTTDGRAWCWGQNDYAQLGQGTAGGPGCNINAPPCRASPVQVSALGNNAAQIATGYYHACALLKDGTLWCWGLNTWGQIGDGTRLGSQCLIGGAFTPACAASPVQVSALGNNLAQVAAAGYRTCARLKDGSVWCWGSAEDYALGAPDAGTTGVPTQVHELSASASDLAIGERHSCAVLRDGTVWCWGSNAYGQIGDGTTEGISCGDGNCRATPVRAGVCAAP